MNVLELFAGIGGMALGLERAGMRAVGFVEINPWCRRVLARHWPEVPQHDDVRTAIAWWLGEPRPRVDIVAGSYPCQPESDAGKGLSTADERWLWPEMARVIHALRPRYVIGENVTGHRTRGLRFVLRDLDRLGYTTRAGIVAAREMGAPHLRKRIFTLAERTDLANTEREPGGPRRTSDAEQGASGRNTDRSGVSTHVADTDREARRPETRHALAGAGGPSVGERPPQPGGCGVALADTGSEGLEGPRQLHHPGTGPEQVTADGGWWAAEPDVGRVAHGVPARVDRLRGLGNAVVPQVAEHIGRILISGAWRDA